MKVACPLAVSVLGGAVKGVAPSKKVTVPVGVRLPDVGTTVAVKVSELKTNDGLVPVVSTNVVLVPTLLIVSIKAGEVLLSKLASPLYTAVML